MERVADAQIGKGVSLVRRSKAQREAVLAEMSRILCDPTFRKSHRCVALLRHMIELALEGDHRGIKSALWGSRSSAEIRITTVTQTRSCA